MTQNQTYLRGEPLARIVLEGNHVRLAPLSLDHVGGLVAASAGSRATYGWTLVPDGAEAMARYVEDLLALEKAGAALPFVTQEASTGKIVGATRFMSIEHWSWPPGLEPPVARPAGNPDVVEIGGTWLSEGAQRTSINTEAKILMLRHAFEVWKVYRVSLKTDARNERSRAAITRLGARFDGVLRAHMPAFDGAIRDTAFFSLLASEWPEVKARLRARLDRGA